MNPVAFARTPRDPEAGSVTLWMLGLTLLLLTAGALSVDLWQAVAVRGEVAGRADAAAAAGASGVDLDAWRTQGVVVLDPGLVVGRAMATLGDVAAVPNDDRPWVAIDVRQQDLTVVVSARVRPLLLRLLDPGAEPIEVTVQRTAEARLD